MKLVDPLDVAGKALKQIRTGAFLLVEDAGAQNVMTIGWASIGFIWGRPIMTILVRRSRHTFTIIERTSQFTVSVPFTDARRELEICGSKSGRDIDKFAACGLKLRPGDKVSTPSIDLPGIHFECRIVYKSAMDPANLVDLYKSLYPIDDYHTLYFGEIVSCFSTEAHE